VLWGDKMNKKELLAKLKTLYEMKEVKSGFPSQQACVEWANSVAPLLKFNQQYYLNFIQNSHKMNLKLSSYILVPAFNIMVSQLQMAITELENEDEGENMENSFKYKEGVYWTYIEKDYNISKKEFGLKINFVKDKFKRKILFRDVEQAYILSTDGFNKPALILAGAVIEELLRLYLESKNIKLTNNTFDYYIKCCEEHKFLKKVIQQQLNVARLSRNLVHIENENEKKHSISTATAKGAVGSIFTIANDF
jgi:hypothetical protein